MKINSINNVYSCKGTVLIQTQTNNILLEHSLFEHIKESIYVNNEDIIEIDSLQVDEQLPVYELSVKDNSMTFQMLGRC